jgi:hypothetical protein
MTIRFKTRIILPAIQVLIAAGLIASNEQRPVPRGEDTIPDSRAYALDVQACWALNAPAAMIARAQRVATHDWLWVHAPSLLPVVNKGILFSLVWMCWYAASIEMGGRGLSVFTPKTGSRRLADVAAILFGASLAPYGNGVSISVLDPYQKLLGCVYLAWALVIIGFYGHDLVASFRAAGDGVPSSTPAA